MACLSAPLSKPFFKPLNPKTVRNLKSIVIALMAFATLAVASLVPNEAKAQSTGPASILLHKKVDGSGTFFNLDTLNGKAITLILIKDSLGTASWLPPAQVDDSVSLRSFTNDKDAAWVLTLLAKQNTDHYGLIPEPYYYRLSSTGTSKLYFPTRIKYALLYYKP